jgi:CDP-6-deoxy-D-xylo-4-hexulose-3-dehydrase
MIKLIKSTFFNEEQTKLELQEFIGRAEVLSMGEEVRRSEESFAKKQGRKYAVMVNSGSSANLILVQAMLNLGRWEKGDTIGVSALTWATNVMPLLQLGLVPLAIDCNLETLNVSVETLKPYVSRMRGLFITNVLGFADRLDEVAALCAEHDVLLLEDNCESLGSRLGGKLLGNFGVASTFSFYVGHHLSTIEGGMICTDDTELYEMLVMTRAHGWDRNLSAERQQAMRSEHQLEDFFARYTFYTLGYNVRPTEINGFLGRKQVEYWDAIVEQRQKNFFRLNDVAQSKADLIPLDVRHMDLVSNFAVPIVARTTEAFQKYRRSFEEVGVEIRPIIAGDITLQPFYKKYVFEQHVCENSRLVHRQGLYFGNNPDMTEDELIQLLDILGSA